MKTHNHAMLKNFLYLALFIKKYEIYYDETPLEVMEETLKKLQYIFERDITLDEYLFFLKKSAKLGTLVLKRAFDYKGAPMQNSGAVKELKKIIQKAREQQNQEKFLASTSTYEELLQKLAQTIADIEESKIIHPDKKGARPNINAFSSEYKALLQCIELNDEVYTLLQKAEESRFANNKEKHLYRRSKERALDHAFDALTHISRHINLTLSDKEEIERFKESMRLSALEFLHITLQSIKGYMQKTNQTDPYKKLCLEYAGIRTLEVTENPITVFPDLKLKYTLAIRDYKIYIA